MTTFTEVNARLKNFLMGWLMVLGLKECLVECATLCVKSEVMLINKTANVLTPKLQEYHKVKIQILSHVKEDIAEANQTE